MVDEPKNSISLLKNRSFGMSLIFCAWIITVLVAVLGPSVVALNLGPRTGFLPPWYFEVKNLNQWLVVVPLWLAIPVAAIGFWVVLRSIVARPFNRPWQVFFVGSTMSIISSLVPPLTSGDILMYSAYGRIQNLGIDPWTVAPADIYRRAYDPVMIWVEKPWQDTPSVYGPIPSFFQWLAAYLGGENMHNIVFWLQLFGLLPFLLIGLLLMLLAKNNPLAQSRVALFIVGNPLLIWAICSGAHNEALCLVWAVLALFFMRKNPWLAGIFIGLAGCTKVSLVFYGLAMVWGYRFQIKNLVKFCIAAMLPLILAYKVLAPKALFAAGRNAGYISSGTWSQLLYQFLGFIGLPDFGARALVSTVGWLLFLGLAWIFSQIIEKYLIAGTPAKEENWIFDPLSIAIRTAFVLSAAWFISSPYTMPWYDLLGWVPLALLCHSKMDNLLIWRGTWLSVGYVASRSVDLLPGIQWISWIIRDLFSASAQCLLFILPFIWWLKLGRPKLKLSSIRRGKDRILAQDPLLGEPVLLSRSVQSP